MKKMVWVLVLLVSVVLCGCSVRVEYERERNEAVGELPDLCFGDMSDGVESDQSELKVIGNYEIGRYTLCIFKEGQNHIVVRIWKEETL